MYVLDTGVCIDFLRGRLPDVGRMVARSDPSMFAVPAIAEAELRLCAEASENPARELDRLELLLLTFQSLPFDSACAREYGAMREKLEARGKAFGPLDMLVAATALAHHATLVSDNVREFSRVPALNVKPWSRISW